MTVFEERRLADGMKVSTGPYTTLAWQAYFRYLLGRDVTVAETDQFLRDEARQVRSHGH